MHPVAAMWHPVNAGRHEEGNHRKKDRSLESDRDIVNSCDGRTVDASGSCNVANAGRHEEEKAASKQ